MANYLDLPDIQAIAADTYGAWLRLSPASLTLILASTGFMQTRYRWVGAGYELTDAEWDTIEAMVAQMTTEVMCNMTGAIIPLVTDTLPAGVLLCDGSVYNRVDYPALYAVLDPQYIIDPNTFSVPDLRDRFVMGASTSNPAGTTGGANDVTLGVNEMPTHSHTTQPHSHSEGIAVPTIVNGGVEAPASSATPSTGITGAATVIVNDAGGGQAHENRPAFLAAKWGILAS